MIYHIRFDMYGTLINSLDLIKLSLGELGYMVHPVQNHFNFKFIEGYAPPIDFQWDTFFYRLFTERFDELQVIDEFAYEFLQGISVDRKPVHIITSRPKGMLMHYTIGKTLERLFPDIEFVIDIVNRWSDKWSRMGGAHFYFEDRRKTCISLSEIGMIVFMRRTSYNKIGSGNRFFGKCIDIANVDPDFIPRGSIIQYDTFDDVINLRIDMVV